MRLLLRVKGGGEQTELRFSYFSFRRLREVVTTLTHTDGDTPCASHCSAMGNDKGRKGQGGYTLYNPGNRATFAYDVFNIIAISESSHISREIYEICKGLANNQL